jgi:type VI secretion system secreted protein Hcp
MASDMVLFIKDIGGETSREGYKGQIEVSGWGWHGEQGVSISGSGLGAGKASMSKLMIKKTVDQATPLLIKHCATGAHITEPIVLTCLKAGGDSVPYLTIKLQDCMIASVKVLCGVDEDDVNVEEDQPGRKKPGAGGADNVPAVEKVIIAYSAIEFNYKTQAQGGQKAANFAFGWDLKKSKTTTIK